MVKHFFVEDDVMVDENCKRSILVALDVIEGIIEDIKKELKEKCLK